MAASDSLSDVLVKMDQLAGCSKRTVIAMEAMWPKNAVVPWSNAYRVARERAYSNPRGAHGGLTVAFLEGFLARDRLG